MESDDYQNMYACHMFFSALRAPAIVGRQSLQWVSNDRKKSL